CADRLIDLALRAGGQDNITVILADIVDAATPTSNVPQIVGAAAVERDNPTRGMASPAGRAAALLHRTGDEAGGSSDMGVDLDARPKRSWWVKALGALVLLAVIAGGIFAGYNWTQDRKSTRLN